MQILRLTPKFQVCSFVISPTKKTVSLPRYFGLSHSVIHANLLVKSCIPNLQI